MADLHSKFLGCMYGLAIGDALGYPVEFMSLNQIRSRYGANGITDFILDGNKIALYSDDTQMALATANGLINSKTDSLDCIMDSIAKEYLIWLDSPDNNRAPGNSCLGGARNMKNGVHWSKSGIKNSKGCGAAMRTAPIGLLFYNDLEKIKQIGEYASSCTHASANAIASGIGAAYAVSLAVNNCQPKDFLTHIISLCEPIDSEFSQKMAQIPFVLHDNTDIALKKLGEGWRGDEALALALYCFFKHPLDYKKTVLLAANTNGDSDSIACIAGAISGAYNGIKTIPSKWIEKIENSSLVNETAEKLYQKIRQD